MRWTTTAKDPVNGEVRELRSFALLPKKLDDGWTVWLEEYGRTARYELGFEWECWVTLKTYSLDHYYW